MTYSVDLFDYPLPESQIAQFSVEPRDFSRLLVLDRNTGKTEHSVFNQLPKYLEPGDLLIFNDSKVFKARLKARADSRKHEVFLLRCVESDSNTSVWLALVKCLRKLEVGDELYFGDLTAELVSSFTDETGEVRLCFDANQEAVLDYCETHGHIPIPPYVENEPEKLSDYQTIYAKKVGSVAAPTSGFHFTQRLLSELEENGIETTSVTLHVGLGTFQPVKTENLEEHPMHAEYVEVLSETVRAIEQARARGSRVIAVGTTTVRTLEGVAKLKGKLEPYSGDVNLFILPGFEFQVVDALITNFHLPKSTLLALVSSFAGRELVLKTYKKAVELDYRFFSFGDAMFIK